MSFHVFDSFTGDDVPTAPELVLGSRWSELSLCGRVRYIALVFGMAVLAIGVFLVVSVM